MHLRAKLAKNRTEHTLPLRDDLAAMLRDRRPANATGNERVFVGLLPRVGLDFLEADLERARIAMTDASGRRFDFHAFRHTALTWAGATGAAGPMLQAFGGHKTPQQVNRYVHPDHLPTQGIIDQLPRFEQKGIGIGIGKAGQTGQNAAQGGTEKGGANPSQVPAKPDLGNKKPAGEAGWAKYPLGRLNALQETR